MKRLTFKLIKHLFLPKDYIIVHKEDILDKQTVINCINHNVWHAQKHSKPHQSKFLMQLRIFLTGN